VLLWPHWLEERSDVMGILWIIIIVVVVLALLGFFGRSYF
jgi:flagellar basal body-associated protein FliL